MVYYDQRICFLKKLTCQYSHFGGKYDDIIPPQLGKAAFEVLGTPSDDKTFILIEESGHQPFINEAEKFEAALIDFVSKY